MKKILTPKILFFIFVIFILSVIGLNFYKDLFSRKTLSVINFFYFIPMLVFFIVYFIKNINSKNDRLYVIIPLITLVILMLCIIIRIIYIYMTVWN